jgi:dethiobiotin synthetase
VSRGVFVTGTDTGVGKTAVAVALVHALRTLGLEVGVMKPVAAGVVSGGRFNDDALALIAASGTDWPYELVNPYLFTDPVAPHLAAEDEGVDIELDTVLAAYARIAADCDIVVVEGAGGWLVPTGPGRSMADVAAALSLPVVTVVGMRLGCLNHALLTVASVREYGLQTVAWVANHVDPEMRFAERNVAALGERLATPMLARLPFDSTRTPQETAQSLDSSVLVELAGG